MKKYIAILVFIIFSIYSSNNQASLANSYKMGLSRQTFESALELSDNQIDLATSVLLLSQEWGTKAHPLHYRYMIDDMALEIIHRLDLNNIPYNQKAIPVINKYLFDESGFKAVDEIRDVNDLFLHTVLEKKQGYCLSLSILYLSITERLGLPVYGVVVPGHFFVRYDDGNIQFNIETTSNGNSADNEHYIEKFNIPKSTTGIYLKNLNNHQVLSCFLNNLGNCYDSAGEPKNAQYFFELAVGITPYLAEAQSNLGNIYLKAGHSNAAIDRYQLAIKINPNDENFYNNIGNAYLNSDQLSKAITNYKKSIQLNPSNAPAYGNIARVYIKQRSYAKANTFIEKSLRLDPKSALNYAIKGDLQRLEGKNIASIQSYKKSISIDNEQIDSYIGIAEAYNNLSEDLKAEQYFKYALGIDGTSVNALWGLASLCNKNGRFNEEIAYWNRLHIAHPDLKGVLQNLGNSYIQINELNEAFIAYQREIQINGENSDLYYNMAIIRSRQQNYSDAKKHFLYAMKLDSEDAKIYNALAVCLYNLGEYLESESYANKAINMGFNVSDDLLKALRQQLEKTGY